MLKADRQVRSRDLGVPTGCQTNGLVTMKKLSKTLTAILLMSVASMFAASVAPPAPASAAQVTRSAVVARAKEYFHYPYAWTGSSPKTGFSCIGFVWYVFTRLGINMPGNLSTALAAYPRIPESSLLPGDIVFFKNTLWKGVSHIAIYIGGGKVIHAENPHRGVNISAIRNDPVEGSYWQEHYMVAERPLGNIGVPPPTATYRQVTVSVPSLNLRSSPSLESVVETVLPKGTRLAAMRAWGKWLHVSLSSGLRGWVVAEGVTLPNGGVPQSGGGSSSYSVLPGVNIHAGPALLDRVLAVSYSGMRVTVQDHRNGFTEIRAPSGLTGWVLSRFIQRAAGGDRSPRRRRSHASDPTARLTIRAHLRTGPSLHARIIKWVPAGTRLAILGRVPLWDHVRVTPRLSGYIYAQFIRG